jgi:F-type H+-transporting ATPase subunit delta
MAERDELIRGYAEALFAVAEAEGETGAVEDQLYAFARLVERDVKVRDALADPSLPAENKRGLIRDVLGEGANPVAVNLLGLVVELGRGRDVGAIVDALTTVAAEHRQHQVAEVRSAVPLDAARKEKLAAALSKATGRSVEVKVVVDPNVIGGLVARLGDEVFDGTVRTRLRDARQRLSGS